MKMWPSFRSAVAQARRQEQLDFAGLLSEDRIDHALGEARAVWRGWIYSPAVTVWVFLAQCLSADHSCRDAVARLLAWRVARGQRPCSADTGAYCTARAALPEEACAELVRATGSEIEAEAPETWLWHGRRVRVLDGSTVTMPDTPENQAAYPQQKTQKRGCGFPIARILVVFSLSVGTVLEAALRPYTGKQTGENSMFRELHDRLAEGDVVLADRYFSGWFDLALLQTRRIDFVVRKHQLRATDFRTGRRLGREDHLVTWVRPQRAKWLTPDEYAALPEQLTLRELRIRVKQKGFRTKSLVVVTTLADAEEFSAEEIAALYRQRWQAELCLRSLKIVLQMDHLRCKQPERVRNELRMHLIAYNLIRRVMAAAALASNQSPWQISFKGTLQTLAHFLPHLHHGPCTLDAWLDALLMAVASHQVAGRPDRFEPRVVKRRPKTYPLMMHPRSEYKRHAA